MFIIVLIVLKSMGTTYTDKIAQGVCFNTDLSCNNQFEKHSKVSISDSCNVMRRQTGVLNCSQTK